MRLNKNNLSKIIPSSNLMIPNTKCFDLPEKVLQFGTGILLRGLPDFIIDKANNKGIFNGRIVVVKSTSAGDTDAFILQDSLYTVCVRGMENGLKTEEDHLVSSISRVLSAANEWDLILDCATNAEMQVIISNTTEVGIALMQDNIHQAPPVSFPGKLVAFLYQRFKHFKGDVKKGMVIIPTELIPDNGSVLLSIVLELAHQNNLETAFIDWIENANHFCNSLVDRIVPGKLQSDDQKKIEDTLGYTDELMIVSEVYNLWAIESDDKKVKDILTFAAANESVVIAKDINKFRELKLRLLNGSHTFSCGLAYLAGFTTVKQAMDNDVFATYISELMFKEIIPAIASEDITKPEAEAFVAKVLDRYRNVFIEHKWLSITTEYSSKMMMRNIQVIMEHVERLGYFPPHMALGFAAHILFMKCAKADDGHYYGEVNAQPYLITDANAAIYSVAWKNQNDDNVVDIILSNEHLWQKNLSEIQGITEEIKFWLSTLINEGALAAMNKADKQKKELAK